MHGFDEITRHFVCLRHGKTAEHEDDRKRQLTDLGREQVSNRREALGDRQFDLVLVPPTDRGRETAKIIVGEKVKVVELEELYSDPSQEKDLNAMADRIGYAPLSTYYKEESGRKLFADHGKRAWQRVLDETQKHVAKNVLVIGSAMLLPAMGHMAIGDGHHDLPSILDMNPGECQGFEIEYWDDDMGKSAHVAKLIA